MKTNDQKEILENKNNNGMQGNKSPNILLGAFMMFIFPLIAIFLGVFLGACIGEKVNGSLLTFQIANINHQFCLTSSHTLKAVYRLFAHIQIRQLG